MKRESIIWLLTATAGAAPILGWEQGSTFDYPGLRFSGTNRQFEITVFSDLHLGDADRPFDNQTIGVMTDVLQHEPSTDLVVLNGDLMSCEWMDQETAYKKLDMIIGPLIGRKMPFTATYGNHDSSRTCSTKLHSAHMWAKANREEGHQLTWTMNSVNGEYNDVGESNYYVPVYSASGGGNPHLKMLLWFFDSKGGGKFDPEHEHIPDRVADSVDPKVISWFKLTRDQIRSAHGNKVIPSLAFVHIPPSVTEAFRKSGLRTETKEPGLNEESISVQADNNPGGDLPFLQALLETEGLMATFSGHDHRIDWCMRYSSAHLQGYPDAANNMHLCFGRHTGYGGYSDYERGGRKIIIKEDELGKNTVETYIRLEGGRISGRVTLNSTYGQDQYPPIQKLKSHVQLNGEADADEQSKSSSKTTLMPTNDIDGASGGDASA